MTNARWSIAACSSPSRCRQESTFATAQVALKAEDLIGTWELVSTKDLKTGAAVYLTNDASTGIEWWSLRAHISWSSA